MSTKVKVIIAIVVIILLIGGYTAYIKFKKPKATAPDASQPIIQVNPAPAASVTAVASSGAVATPPAEIHSDTSPVVDNVAHVLEDGVPVTPSVTAPIVVASAPVTTPAPDPLPVQALQPTPIVIVAATPPMISSAASLTDLAALLSSENYKMYNLQLYANRTPTPLDAAQKLADEQAYIDAIKARMTAIGA